MGGGRLSEVVARRELTVLQLSMKLEHQFLFPVRYYKNRRQSQLNDSMFSH